MNNGINGILVKRSSGKKLKSCIQIINIDRHEGIEIDFWQATSILDQLKPIMAFINREAINSSKKGKKQ